MIPTSQSVLSETSQSTIRTIPEELQFIIFAFLHAKVPPVVFTILRLLWSTKNNPPLKVDREISELSYTLPVAVYFTAEFFMTLSRISKRAVESIFVFIISFIFSLFYLGGAQ